MTKLTEATTIGLLIKQRNKVDFTQKIFQRQIVRPNVGTKVAQIYQNVPQQFDPKKSRNIWASFERKVVV